MEIKCSASAHSFAGRIPMAPLDEAAQISDHFPSRSNASVAAKVS